MFGSRKRLNSSLHCRFYLRLQRLFRCDSQLRCALQKAFQLTFAAAFCPRSACGDGLLSESVQAGANFLSFRARQGSYNSINERDNDATPVASVHKNAYPYRSSARRGAYECQNQSDYGEIH